MIFTYKKWRKFCAELQKAGWQSRPACEVEASLSDYVVLKHDVETAVKHAFDIAKIEHEYGHRGSYYVQAYLLNNSQNVALLQQMRDMGHEISYHYDVLDACKGDLDAAIDEFDKSKARFEECGFPLVTVCQHGNPVVERVGYTSNRDFFRSERVRERYPTVADVMVNFQEQRGTTYRYFSDAGRQFKHIYDPLNNDVVDSADRDVVYADLEALFGSLEQGGRYIISIHPHRWTRSAWLYRMKNAAFHMIRAVAKLLIKIPLFKKVMSRYYYLAKKI
ncbi:MAG: hypothetical protein IJO59_06880 [Clostridia bacterium]|nr:hypothetical protein [Clostridia bacterium]